MPEIEESPKPLNVETLAKAVALIATAGLVLAFFYDSVFFWTLDTRLMRLLVMSDHIEAAIATLPVVGLFAFGMWWVPYMVHVRVRPWMNWVGGAAIVGMTGVYFYFAWITLWEFLAVAAVSLAACAMVIFFVSRYMFGREGKGVKARFPSGVKPQVLLGYTFAVFLIAVPLVAFVQAKKLRDAMDGRSVGPNPLRFADSLWLTDMTSISGEIVRVIDRGVIVAVPSNPRQFLFIPKEQIRRLDYQR